MRLIRLLWRYSLFVTVPVSILFATWGLRTLQLYYAEYEFGLFGRSTILYDSGRVTAVYLQDSMQEAILGSNVDADFNLFLDDGVLRQLNSDLPYSGLGGENFQPAYMAYPNGEIERIQVRYRGDMTNHWLFKAKSLRIKTRKKMLLGDMRRFNLVVNEGDDIVGPHLSYQLANMMGLLAPASEMVTVNINGKFDGLRMFVEQVDESFLRRRNIMPGDIYSGDNIGRSRYWGLPRSLFESSLNWDKASANNHYPLDSKAPLEAMLESAKRKEFTSLDMEAFGTFAAYIDLINNWHHDGFHNWKLHYDHYTERFSPIVWDSDGWLDYWADSPGRGGIISAPLLRDLYLDHDFLFERQKALLKFYRNFEAEFLQVVENDVLALQEKAADITHYVALLKDIYGSTDVQRAVSEFPDKVGRVLHEVKEATVDLSGVYAFEPTAAGVRVEISRVPVSRLRIEFETGTPLPEKMIVQYTLDGELIERDVSLLLERDGNSIVVNQRLMPASVLEERHRFRAATYDLLIEGASKDAIAQVWMSPMSMDDNEIAANQRKNIEIIEFIGESNIVHEPINPEPVIFSGSVAIDDFRTIYRDVVIQPGTQLLFGEGAGLRIYGKLHAVGTQTLPITFTAKNRDAPWGALVLKDDRADDSRIVHCTFENGSGLKGSTFEYTALLSIHNVTGVLIEKSLFKDSRITDDMLHTVYSDVTILDSEFHRSRSDAADLDISTAQIINSKFLYSGNDGLDLMSTQAVVRRSTFSDSGDKAVSVGENSELIAVNSIFSNSEVGVQSKDRSHAMIFNSVISENKIGVDAYQKNLQYGGGGTLTVTNSILENNHETATADGTSKVAVIDSYVDAITKGESNVSYALIDSSNKLRPAGDALSVLAGDVKAAAAFRMFADRKVRGLTPSKGNGP
ncbi:CotH kinase family protein [Candidatus Marimicrobium litorale]|uniref:Right handed beta helix domain-containing protein n=1 Tax=Candidatus Marimicrobium litorale TaxID=2518991 RepID=A0ABT3T929_9GAMM|nr:CotH kinase family protein [Candidatus Marimicrobium litorale]MCX2978793.1 hypothetical protein [Candidatus Marimicrobium litorale]